MREPSGDQTGLASWALPNTNFVPVPVDTS